MSRKSPAKREQPYHHGDLARALIAAAEEILNERGLEGFTLRECARRAGVSHAAPAHHFGDVTGLLTAIAAAGFNRLTAATTAARDATASGTPADQLLAMMLAYVETAVASPAAFRLMFASKRIDPSDRRFQESGEAAYDVLKDMVAAAAQASGRTTPGPYDPEVTMVWSVAHGFASLLVEGRLGRGVQYHGGHWRTRAEDVFRRFIDKFSGGIPLRRGRAVSKQK